MSCFTVVVSLGKWIIKMNFFLLIFCIFYIFPSGTSLYLSSAREKAIFQTEKKKRKTQPVVFKHLFSLDPLFYCFPFS